MADTFITSTKNYVDKHAMDIVLDPEWLEDPEGIHPTIDGFAPEQINELKFSKKGAEEIKNKNLWILSGNHRRLALVRHVERMEKELKDQRDTIDDIKGGKTEVELHALPEAPKERLRKAQEIAVVLEAMIKLRTYWTVHIYDRGACLRRVRGVRTGGSDRSLTGGGVVDFQRR